MYLMYLKILFLWIVLNCIFHFRNNRTMWKNEKWLWNWYYLKNNNNAIFIIEKNVYQDTLQIGQNLI